GAGPLQCACEPRLEDHGRVESSMAETVLDAVGSGDLLYDLEEAGCIHPLDDSASHLVAGRARHADSHVFELIPDGIAKEAHHQNGHPEKHHQRASISKDVPEFLPHKTEERPPARIRLSPHGLPRANRTNSSSTESVANRALSSVGVPRAAIRPFTMLEIRSQYTASSMSCVVTTTVTPRSAAPETCSQTWRRAMGSTPRSKLIRESEIRRV